MEFIIIGGTSMPLYYEYKNYFKINLIDPLTCFLSINVKKFVKFNEESWTKSFRLTVKNRQYYCYNIYHNDIILYVCIRLEIGV